MKKNFLGEQHIHLLTPDMEPTIDQTTDATKVQFGEPMSFIRVTYKNMVEMLRIRGEMTQRQLHHQSPPQHVGKLTKLGT